jgi:tetratricopeptide (TPR) repeat protein
MSRFATWGLTVLLTGFPALIGAATLPQIRGASEQKSLLPVPYPDLSAMEETARQKVELAQATLEQAQERSDVPLESLIEGFGYLGKLFHAFKLLDAAETCYLNSRSLAVADYRWSYYLGLVRYAKGDLENSLEDFEAALGLSDDPLPILIRLGNVLVELNRGEEAKDYYERALELEPSSAAALFGLGKAESLVGDDAAAVGHLERALELQPEADIIHYPLGQAYRRLGEMERAMEHLRQRGQQEVRFPDPLGSQVARLAKGTAFEIVLSLAREREVFSEEGVLGFALGQLGDVPGAIEQLREGLALRAESEAGASEAVETARIHFVMGGLLVNEGRDDEAIDHFRAAVELDSDLKDARIKLGNVLARRGQLEEATVVYSEVLNMDPDHRGGLLKRAAALMAQDRYEEAKPDLEKLVKLEPDRAEARLRLAVVYQATEDLEGAIDSYRLALDLDLSPDERLRALVRLGRLLEDRGQVEEAASRYREALESDPQNVAAVSALAGLLVGLSRFEEAAELYGQWVALEPEKPQPYLAEATALIFSGKHEEATRRLETGLDRFPDLLDFKDVLARHLAACPEAEARNGERALELALEVWERIPSLQSTETVAMAYAESGLFGEAVEWQRRLIDELQKEQLDPAILERLRRNLALYESGSPCCWEGD